MAGDLDLLGEGWWELSDEGPPASGGDRGPGAPQSDRALRDARDRIELLVKSEGLSRPLDEAARATLQRFGWAERPAREHTGS